MKEKDENKRVEFILDFPFWMRLKNIAMINNKTFSKLVREILTEWMGDYEQRQKTKSIESVGKEPIVVKRDGEVLLL